MDEWGTGLRSVDGFRCTSERIGGGAAVVTVTGELDLCTSGQLAAVLDELAGHGITDRTVIDLGGCSFMDSTGLGVLAKARLTRSPLHVVVNHTVTRFFELAGVTKLYDTHRSREEAIAALRDGDGALERRR
jgi:anti-anti-sigma factor